jgi:putative transposase
MQVSDQIINQLSADYKFPKDLLVKQGILKQLTKKPAERALEGEMERHCCYAKHDVACKNTGNSHNGKSRKSVRNIYGDIELKTPPDHNGRFDERVI